jgi:hypothetical protein
MFSVSVLPLNPINQFFHLYSFVDLSFLWPSQGKLFDHLITNLVVGSKQGKDRICILAGSAGERLPEFCQSLLYLLCLQNRGATTFPDCRVYRSGNFNSRILWPSLAECLRLGGAGLVDDNQCSKLTPNVNIWTVWIDPFGHPERSLYDFPRSFVQIHFPGDPVFAETIVLQIPSVWLNPQRNTGWLKIRGLHYPNISQYNEFICFQNGTLLMTSSAGVNIHVGLAVNTVGYSMFPYFPS